MKVFHVVHRSPSSTVHTAPPHLVTSFLQAWNLSSSDSLLRISSLPSLALHTSPTLLCFAQAHCPIGDSFSTAIIIHLYLTAVPVALDRDVATFILNVCKQHVLSNKACNNCCSTLISTGLKRTLLGGCWPVFCFLAHTPQNSLYDE